MLINYGSAKPMWNHEGFILFSRLTINIIFETKNCISINKNWNTLKPSLKRYSTIEKQNNPDSKNDAIIPKNEIFYYHSINFNAWKDNLNFTIVQMQKRWNNFIIKFECI